MSVSTDPYFSGVAGNPANPNFLEVVWGGHALDNLLEPRPIKTIWNFAKVTDGTGVNVPTDVSTALALTLNSQVSPLLSDAFVGDNTRVREMDDPSTPWWDDVAAAGGGMTTDRSPLFVAVTWRASVSARGRHYRSNKHWSPIVEADTEDDELTSAAVTAWTTAIGAVFTNITTITDANGNVWRPVVLSRSLCELKVLPTSFSGCRILGYTLNSTITTMRRRRQKAGS